MNFEIFIHLANVMFLVSFLLKDIFLLRFVNLLAGFMLLIFYIFGDSGPQSASIMWNIVFNTVNIVQLIKLYNERKPIVLTEGQQEIYLSSFSEFTKNQFLKLLSAAENISIEKGNKVINNNEVAHEIIMPLNNNLVDEFSNVCGNRNSFIGAANYITNTTPQKSLFTEEKTDILKWQRTTLENLLNKDAELKSRWQSKMSECLALQIHKNS